MGRHLERALARVQKGACEEALDCLVEAWRSHQRAPEIADVVERLEAMLERAPVAGAETWPAAAKRAKSAVDRGPLLRAIAGFTMAQILEALSVVRTWDDPRVGSVIVALLRDLRFSGKRSQTFWRDVIATIPELRDPRFLELARTLPETWKVGEMQQFLARRMAEATKGLAPVDLGSPERALVAKIAAAVDARSASEVKASAAARAPRGGATRSAETLLADIHANPADDAPRMVYADWLMERNDPRGELIALQLRPEAQRDKAALKREKELLKAHKKSWLGAIAPVVGGELEFRRGFLATATLKLKNQKDVEQYGSLPEWATLEVIDWGSGNVRTDQQEWARWIGPSMRHLREAVRPLGKHLLAGDTTWALEVVELWTTDGELDAETFRRIIASPKKLPRLERVFLMGSGHDRSWLEGVTDCIPELQVRESGLDWKGMKAWLEAAEKTRLKALVFDAFGPGKQLYRFTRDASEKLTRLETILIPNQRVTSLSPRPVLVERAIEYLQILPRESLTHFEASIQISGAMTPAEEVVAAALAAVR